MNTNLKKNPQLCGFFYVYFSRMKKSVFQMLAKFNKAVLPSFTKRRLDLAKASKLQLGLFAYRLWVTKNALG
jgi:hypothetical protein